MKVLIVDSDWYFLGQARGILESRGNYVVHETDPAEALARARKWRPDVVMVSVDIPDCHAGDLLADFAAIQPRPAILLVSALDGFDKAWHAWQRGGDEVLFRPILHPSELHVGILTARENAVCPRRRWSPAAEPAARSA